MIYACLLAAFAVSATDARKSAWGLGKALMWDLFKSDCEPVDVVDDFNVEEYVRKSWFVQYQQVTGYLPENSFYCVVATYELENSSVPFFDGKVVSVYNYANRNSVNGNNMNAGQKLCARQEKPSDPAKLSVAPCFLPNFLAGDYWVVAAGPTSENYEWAIISAGQPKTEYDDGCTTKETGINGAGFWFFTREKVASQATINEMMDKAEELGFTTSRLKKVEQEGCTYEGARLK